MPDVAAFKIPAALDGRGRLLVPEEATRRGTYRCPMCEATVDLHAGSKKRRHFHHREATCSAESVVHLCAKRLVAQAVESWLEGGPPVVFERRCASASEVEEEVEDGACEARCRQPIPAKVVGVALERRLPSGHVADIALLARGVALPVAVIEIVHTHAVDARKAFELGVPWVEVAAAQVCDDAGRLLVVGVDRFLPWFCAEHEALRGRASKTERAHRATAAALARRLAFRLADFPGYRIARVGRCSQGHDSLVFAWEGKDPPWPRPPLVVAVQKDFDWSRRGGARAPTKTLAYRRSYASACATCGEPLAP